MPSYRVEGETVSLQRYDVIGADGQEPNFISHVGLSSEGPNQSANQVSIVDMAPPLRGPNTNGKIKANAVGNAELNIDEASKIERFIDQHALEHEAFQSLPLNTTLQRAPEMYAIIPHVQEVTEENGSYVRTRFSCAGFVIEAYRFARINLVDSASLVDINLTLIRQAYPKHFALFERMKISFSKFGLSGEGPWPVLLCGYILNGLNRSAESIRQQPHNAIEEDRYFPHKAK